MESSVVLSSDFADGLILAFCAVSGWGWRWDDNIVAFFVLFWPVVSVV